MFVYHRNFRPLDYFMMTHRTTQHVGSVFISDEFGGLFPLWTIMSNIENKCEGYINMEKAIEGILQMAKIYEHGYITIYDNCNNDAFSKEVLKAITKTGRKVIEFHGGEIELPDKNAPLTNTLFDVHYYRSMLEELPLEVDLVRGRLVQMHGFQSVVLMEKNSISSMLGGADRFINMVRSSNSNGLIVHSNEDVRKFILDKAEEIGYRVIQFNAKPSLSMLH